MTGPNRASVGGLTRRRFLSRSSLAVASAAAIELPFVSRANAATDMEIKIGLIGCGGRGTGALLDALGAATKVIYPATGYHTEDVAVPKNKCFTGFDAYKQRRTLGATGLASALQVL